MQVIGKRARGKETSGKNPSAFVVVGLLWRGGTNEL